MNCVNCGVEAGRKGNYHVKARKFTCTRRVKRLETKRKWYGAREENWVVVEVPSYYPSDYSLTDWQSTDETRYRHVDSRFDDYSDYSRSYETPSVDYSSRSSSYDSTPSYTPPSSSDYDSSPSSSSWGSSSSSDSSWGSSSSSSSSSSSDSGSSGSGGGYSCGSGGD